MAFKVNIGILKAYLEGKMPQTVQKNHFPVNSNGITKRFTLEHSIRGGSDSKYRVRENSP